MHHSTEVFIASLDNKSLWSFHAFSCGGSYTICGLYFIGGGYVGALLFVLYFYDFSLLAKL